MATNNLDYEINKLLKEIGKSSKKINTGEELFGDNFEDFLKDGAKKFISGTTQVQSTCDPCNRKKIITIEHERACNKEYIPPYIDEDCRDFKLALVLEKVDSRVVEKVFKFLIYKVSISETVQCIENPNWKKEAENILRATGYYNFIKEQFGNLNKEDILQLLFDVNFCYFDRKCSRCLTRDEYFSMIKHYIVYTLREKIKDNIIKIIELIELDLEYQIAVVEGEIKYIIRCLLERLVITNLDAGGNYAIDNFNKVGALTKLLEGFNGLGNGKHDQRKDFSHIRDTIHKYEKVLRTSFDFLNRKIKQLEELMGERTFIVGVTGLCEKRPSTSTNNEIRSVIVPQKPIVILNPEINGLGEVEIEEILENDDTQTQNQGNNLGSTQ